MLEKILFHSTNVWSTDASYSDGKDHARVDGEPFALFDGRENRRDKWLLCESDAGKWRTLLIWVILSRNWIC